MGFFDHIQKKGSTAIKAQPAQIRKEIVVAPANPQKTLNTYPRLGGTRHLPGQLNGKRKSAAVWPNPKFRDQNQKKRPSLAQPRLESDSDESSVDEFLEDSRKRARMSTDVEVDTKRQVRCRKAFSDEDYGSFPMVHAADIASLSKPTKYRALFPEVPRETEIYLQYPSASQREKYVINLYGYNTYANPSRYALVEPIQKDDFKPLEEIREVLEVITNYYLPEKEATAIKDDSHGLLIRLKRATNKRVVDDYVALIHEWNDSLTKLIHDGTIIELLDDLKSLDLKLIERILTQTYSRTVSLRIGLLRQYENGTDNVYGELLPKFISDILRKDTKMNSDQIFVDLGSGVGNVVLQAALEIGCESWGCEMMENACDLAELQEKEFKVRCRLWGLAVGDIHLQRGDFLENAKIGKALKKADVVLVNNQAFTPELNDRLVSLFLDLKEGCQIVSLKSFVPAGHKITSRNINHACNVLDVVEKRYYSACVSWTDAPGTYFVAKKDSSRLKSFLENEA